MIAPSSIKKIPEKVIKKIAGQYGEITDQKAISEVHTHSHSV